MSQPKPELALRYRGGDRHHLFLNHGTWFLRYSVREAPWLKADRRVAFSLGTKDLEQAKERRDVVLAHLQFHAAVTAKGVIQFSDVAKGSSLHAIPRTRATVDSEITQGDPGSIAAETGLEAKGSSSETPAPVTRRTAIARHHHTDRPRDGEQRAHETPGLFRPEGRAA